MPESNFVSELNSSAPQPAQRYVPSSLTLTYSPVNGRSVPWLAQDLVLLGRQPLAPLLVGELDFAPGVCFAVGCHGHYGSAVTVCATVNATMKFGVAIFPTEAAQTPAEIARMAEERGLRVPAVPRAHAHPGQPRVRRTPAAASCRPTTAAPTTRSSR